MENPPTSERVTGTRTGQISTQGASARWLQRCTVNVRRVSGNNPSSTNLTQVRFTPRGTACSDLQTTVQAWHPMHVRLSMTNP
jgi:hypothetical protein